MEESFKKVFVLFVLCLLLVSQVSAQYFYDMGEKEPIPFRFFLKKINKIFKRLDKFFFFINKKRSCRKLEEKIRRTIRKGKTKWKHKII